MILSSDIANQFIDKITAFSQYNINIMNAQGIIIAASIEKKRIGTFHELAFRMVQEHIEEIKTEPDSHHYLGTEYGMNALLKCGHEVIGVVGMTGVPYEVEALIRVVRISLESMIEYETRQSFLLQQKNQKLKFMNTLLFSENEEELSCLSEYAAAFGFSEQLNRVPILISLLPFENSNLLIGEIQSSQGYSSQDMILSPAENEILIFKSLPQSLDRTLENCAFLINDFLAPFFNYAANHSIVYRVFVGSIHKRLIDYRHGYRHCNWMRFFYRKDDRRVLYFYDCVEDYLTYQIPCTELERVYSFFAENIPADLKASLLELIPVLDANGYNLNKASKELFIHKNTLVFRLNKLRDYLSMDPLQDSRTRKFLYYLAYYLRNVKHDGWPALPG